MLRYIFSLLILGLVFFWVYRLIYSGNTLLSQWETSSNTQAYETLLEKALSRNTSPIVKSHSVAFIIDNFVTEQEQQSLYFQKTSRKQDILTGELIIKRQENYLQWSIEDISSSQGNFWNPDAHFLAKQKINNGCAWLIYDPCIIFQLPKLENPSNLAKIVLSYQLDI